MTCIKKVPKFSNYSIESILSDKSSATGFLTANESISSAENVTMSDEDEQNGSKTMISHQRAFYESPSDLQQHQVNPIGNVHEKIDYNNNEVDMLNRTEIMFEGDRVHRTGFYKFKDTAHELKLCSEIENVSKKLEDADAKNARLVAVIDELCHELLVNGVKTKSEIATLKDSIKFFC